MPHPRSGVECPYIGGPPRVQWRRELRGRIGFKRQKKAESGLKRLEMRGGDARAIAPSHQHAVLGFAQIRDAHGEPNSDRYQRDGKSEGCNVRQHAPAKVVRFVPLSLIARQIIRLVRSVVPRSLAAGVFWPAWRVSQGARPEFHHAVLFFGRDGLLGFHWSQLRSITDIISTIVRRLIEKC